MSRTYFFKPVWKMKHSETFIKQLSWQINKQILKTSTPPKPTSNIIDNMKIKSGNSRALGRTQIVEINFLMKCYQCKSTDIFQQ